MRAECEQPVREYVRLLPRSNNIVYMPAYLIMGRPRTRIRNDGSADARRPAIRLPVVPAKNTTINKSRNA